MKKIILSALLAGVTTGLAFSSSAQALDPSKYSAGLGLGWGAQEKTTYSTNMMGDGVTIKAENTFTTNKYITQKSFPTVDLRLGYNVNSFLQLGVNALYTHKMESSVETNIISNFATPTPTNNFLVMRTKENLFDLMVRAHLYSPENSMGATVFTGPSAGWESSKMYIIFQAAETTAPKVSDANYQEGKTRKNTAVLAWDIGIAQKINKSGTSLELMGTILADMQIAYKAGDFNGATHENTTPPGHLTRKIKSAARLSLAVKQSF